MMLMPIAEQELDSTQEQPMPASVAMVMSALEAGEYVADERRETGRLSYRTTTHLRLFRDPTESPGLKLYTRDINGRGLGFITQHRLPLGYGGIVLLPGDSEGKLVGVHCTLSRCREAAPGWFEGCLHFNREQPHLASR